MQYNVGDIIEYKNEEYEIIEINPEAKRPYKLLSVDGMKSKVLKSSKNFEIVLEAPVMNMSYTLTGDSTSADTIEIIVSELEKDDKVRDHNGDCWTIAKIHEIPASAADDDAVELVGYDVDVKEKCMSFKKEQLTKITEEEYLEFYKEDETEVEEKKCDGKCDNCTCNSNDVNESKEEDVVNQPNHYRKGKIEVIEFLEDQGLDFRLSNSIKYICRCQHKGKMKEDLEKAIWYLRRVIEKEF